VGTKSDEQESKEETKPFIHQVQFLGPQGEIVRIWGLFDDGAMKEAMSTTMFHKVKHRLGRSQPSPITLRMANGSLVKSLATWEGTIQVGGVQTHGSFEVFDSCGSWDFLFGKRLLKAFKAVHDYDNDEVIVKGIGGSAVLRNQAHLVADRKQLETPAAPVCAVTEDEPPHEEEEPVTEIDVEALQDSDSLFTRATEPYKPERVNEILRLVTIGSDLSDNQRTEVRQLIRSFADVFALSMHEVKHVEDAIHHLDIDPKAIFSKKVHQKPLTPPQRQYLYKSINVMRSAGIIEPCLPQEVKCISATTLAQKAHLGKGLALVELQHRVNDQCITHGMEPRFDLPPRRWRRPTTAMMKIPSGGYARTSLRSTRSQRLLQCRKGTYEQSNSGCVGTGGSQGLISRLDSMRSRSTQNLDLTQRSMLKEGGISGINACHLVLPGPLQHLPT